MITTKCITITNDDINSNCITGFLTAFELTQSIQNKLLYKIADILFSHNHDDEILKITIPTNLAGVLINSTLISAHTSALNVVVGKLAGVNVFFRLSEEKLNINDTYIQVYYKTMWSRQLKIKQIENDNSDIKILDKIYIDVKLIPYI